MARGALAAFGRPEINTLVKSAPRAAAILGLVAATQVALANTLMSPEWATAACEQWNRTPVLQEGLAGSWIKNDDGKGRKVIHLYRSECGEPSKVELRIAAQDGKATCTYGGKVESATLNSSVDYLMHATTAHWGEMGRGQYGPMRAMISGALRFSGPKMEAMSVMGPFEAFLLLVGKVPGEAATCPRPGS